MPPEESRRRTWGRALLLGGLGLGLLLLLVVATLPFFTGFVFYVFFFFPLLVLAAGCALLGGSLLALSGGADGGTWRRRSVRALGVVVFLVLLVGSVVLAADATPPGSKTWPLEVWGVPLAIAAAAGTARASIGGALGLGLAAGALAVWGVAALAGGSHFWSGLAALVAALIVGTQAVAIHASREVGPS